MTARRRTGRRPHGRRYRHDGRRAALLFGVLPAVLVLAASLPFGSVAPWARSAALSGCLLVAAIGLAISLRGHRPEPGAHTRLRALLSIPALCLLLALTLWTLLQVTPMPAGALAHYQPRLNGIYRALRPGAAEQAIALDVFRARGTLALWLAYACLLWACARALRGRAAARVFGYAMAAAGTLQALFAILAQGSQRAGNPFAGPQLIGTFSSGNALGGLLALTLPLTLGLLLGSVQRALAALRKRGALSALWTAGEGDGQPLLAVPLLAALLLQGVALVKTRSLGAMGAAGAGSGLLLLWFAAGTHELRSGRARRWCSALAALLCLAAAGAVFLLLRAQDSAAGAALGVSVISRGEIWSAAGRLLQAHPLGVGPGCFLHGFARFQPPGFGLSRIYHAHCDYLELLCELGWVGGALLAGLLLLYLPACLRPAFAGRTGRARWVRRGALCAVLAGLLHAGVDFNLTSRPGVAVAFFAIAGLTLAGAGAQGARRYPRGLRRVCHTAGLAAVALSLFVCWTAIVIRQTRSGWAAWQAEGARVALGEEPDPYLWLPPPRVPADRAPAVLDRAVAAAPGDSWMHYLRGMAAVLELEVRVRAVAEELAARNTPGVTPAVAARLARVSLREEELRACRAATGHVARAMALSPWDPDIRAGMSICLGRLAAATPEPEPAAGIAARALRQASLAVSLATNQALVVASACEALSHAGLAMPPRAGSACDRLLRRWGRHALWLRGGADQSVLESWHRAGIPLVEMVAGPEVPLPAIWQTYRIFQRAGDGTACLRTLDALELALDQRRGEPDKLLEEKEERSDPLDYRRRLVTERARWMLHLGRLEAYRKMRAARRGVRRTRVAERTRLALALGVRTSFLALRRLDATLGLDAADRLLLCELQAQAGHRDEALALLAEICLGEGELPVERLRQCLESGHWGSIRSYALAAAEALLLLREGRAAEAELRVRQAVQTPIPTRFKHRLQFLLARCLLAQDKARAARAALAAGLEDCPHDTDQMELLVRHGGAGRRAVVRGEIGPRAVERLARHVPPFELGTEFLGRRVVLTGFDLQRDPQGGEPVLGTYWRFDGSVPSDLRAVVRLRDRTGNLWLDRETAFATAAPLSIVGGQPKQGCTVVIRSPLGSASTLARELTIGLKHGSPAGWVESAEGLLYVTLADWRTFLRRDLTATARNTALPIVRTHSLDGATAAALQRRIESVWQAEPADAGGAPAARGPLRIELQLANRHPIAALDLDVLGPSGFAIHTASNTVRVTAAARAGLIYGLEHLLSRAAGRRCHLPDRRFQWSRDVERNLPPLWLLEAPAFAGRYFSLASRGALGPEAAEPDDTWAAHNGLTLDRLAPRPEFSHNLHRIYDPDRYCRQHPEWYPLLEGARSCPTNHDWQVCLSAPGIVRRAVAAAADRFEAEPRRQTFSIGINDGARWCQCEACRALCPPAERDYPANERFWSDPYWRFANRVAAGVAEKFPDRRLGALAYLATAPAPSFDLAPNLDVFLCQDAGGRFDERYRAEDAAEQTAWRARTRHLHRYGYAGLASWVFPRYCRDELADDIRGAFENGVRTFYLEDKWVPWLDGGLPWIVARLLWDPYQDPRALQRTFCASCFGAGADAMDRYFETLQDLWRSPMTGQWFDGLHDPGRQAVRYTAAARARLTALLNEARAAAAGDAAALARMDAVAWAWPFGHALAEESARLRKPAADPRSPDTPLAELTARRRAALARIPDSGAGARLHAALRAGNALRKWSRRVGGSDTATPSASPTP